MIGKPAAPSAVTGLISQGRSRIFPKKFRLLHFLLRVGGFRQREDGIDDRLNFRWPISLSTSINSPLPPINEPRMLRCRPNSAWTFSLTSPPRRHPAGDQAPVGGERVKAILPHRRAHVLDDHVHAALAGQALHFLGDGLRGVIDSRVRAEVARLFQLLIRPGHGKDPRTRQALQPEWRRCPRPSPHRSPERLRRAAILRARNSMCQAVRNTSGTAAASSKSKSPGMGITFMAGDFTYSA